MSELSRILKVGSVCAAAKSLAQAEPGLYAAGSEHVGGKPDDKNRGKPGANDMSLALHPAKMNAITAPLQMVAITSISFIFGTRTTASC